MGSGLRASVVRDFTLGFDLGSGLMYEDERLDEERLEPGEPVRTETVEPVGGGR